MSKEEPNVKPTGSGKVLLLTLFIGFVFGFSAGFGTKDYIINTFSKSVKTDMPAIPVESRAKSSPETQETPTTPSDTVQAPSDEETDKEKTKKPENVKTTETP